MISINNRRYIGCKTKLLEEIYNTVNELGFDSKYSFADIFAGTGVVANYFANRGYQTLVNDTLMSNVISYEAWLGEGKLDLKKISKLIQFFNKIDASDIEANYFSNVYGGKYFSVNDAKKIGYIREYIESNKEQLSKREYAYLITSLMYGTDKIANTVGHFESFLNKKPEDKSLKLDMLNINFGIKPSDIYGIEANRLVRVIKYDVVYIDPPYNSRQYINFYHVLENLVRWDKPLIFEGNSMKFERNELKSGYCRKNEAVNLFSDLIQSIDCKLIIVSYNNTYSANSISSVNTIAEKDLIKILEKKGKLTIKEMNYKYFNAGKTSFKNHKEYLYICEVIV